MSERPAFKHGTAEVWIVGAAAVLVVGLVGFMTRIAYVSFSEQGIKIDGLDRRFISVEEQTKAIHLQLVDIPNIKLDQARMELRLQRLEADNRELMRKQSGGAP